MLIQEVVFRATNGTKKTHKILNEVRQGQILPGNSDVWNNKPVAIPAVPPSGLGGCGIIDVSYRLEFRVDPSGPHFDLVLGVPITIGTIPLRSMFPLGIGAVSAPPPYHQQQAGIVPVTNNWETFPEGPQPSPNEYYGGPAASAPPPAPMKNPTAPPQPLEGYDFLPPPSYTEAIAAHEDGRSTVVRTERDCENTEANWDYRPRYPVWSMPHPRRQ